MKAACEKGHVDEDLVEAFKKLKTMEEKTKFINNVIVPEDGEVAGGCETPRHQGFDMGQRYQ